MSVSSEIMDRLAHLLNGTGGTGAASARLQLSSSPDSVDWLAGFRREGPAPFEDRFYWNCPAEGVTVLGLGAFREVGTSGAERFCEAERGMREFMETIPLLGDSGPPDRGPLMLGGFAFADRPVAPEGFWRGFPSGRLVLPEILLVRRDGELWLTLSCDDFDPIQGRVARAIETLFDPTGPAVSAEKLSGFEREGPQGMTSGPEYRVQSDRSHADYCAQVDAARRAIAAGKLEKVVLARSLHVQHDGRFDLAGLLRRLVRLYPSCVTFAFQRHDRCFLGATPELLVARHGDTVRSAALAGSCRRGRTPDEDDRLGRALCESKKEQEEHAFVVRAIARALAPVCSELTVPEAPRLFRIEGIQHLETPIEGTLERDQRSSSVAALCARLHPTPAVGGAPAAEANRWIACCEGLDRGWYAGPIGFIDREGGGEFRVALRSALIRSGGASDEALLFAGGGIVSGSDPRDELEETRMKLRALLAPLTEI